MSVRTGFFSDGTEYFQPDFAAFLKDSLADGYVLDFENELEVIASTPATMTVEIQPGRCWVQGYFGWVQDANEVLTIAANASGNPRVDRIVARLSVTTDRKISFEVLQGTPGAVPVAPALTRTDETYEISLAQIAVADGATSITTGNITDERGDTSVCGIAGIKHDWRFAAEQVRIEVDPADVNVGVSDRDPVYWDGTEWNVAGAGNPPQGYYDDANSGVVTHGYMDGFAGLTPGDAQDFGIALSATEVYVTRQYTSEFAYTSTRIITPSDFETYGGTVPVGLIPADSTAEMIISVSEALPAGFSIDVGTVADPDVYFYNAPVDAVGVVGVAYKGVGWGTSHAADTLVQLILSPFEVWTAKNNLNTARRGLAGCGTTLSALCMGGYTSAYSAVTEQWDGTNWTAKNNLNTARSYLAGCGTTSSALCMGGSTGANLAVTEQWDGTNWTAKNNLNTARHALAGCGTTLSALCMGGYTSAYSAVTEQWDGTNWTAKNNLNTARYVLAGCGTTSSALCMGGYTGAKSAVTEQWDGTNWTAKNNLNTARSYLAGCGTTSSALCMGGTTGAASAVTEQWDGTNWTAKNNLNTARHALAGCGTTLSALCMGGYTSANSAVTEQWDGIPDTGYMDIIMKITGFVYE